MKFLLVAINAKYIHSNPGIYSLKAYAEAREKQGEQGDPRQQNRDLPAACVSQHRVDGFRHQVDGSRHQVDSSRHRVEIELAEYTINHQMEQILEDIFRRSPDVVGLSCYIWNLTYVLDLIHDLHKVLPDTDIWQGGPEVSYDAPQLLAREPEVLGVMKGEGEETFWGLIQAYELLGQSVRSQRAGTDQDAGAGQSAGADQDAGAGRGAEAGQRVKTGPEHLAAFWDHLGQLSGLAYRDESGAVRDHAVRPVMDMSRIPFLYPDLERFEHRIIYYESSRGCPFSCSYCLSSIDKSVRFRDLGLVKQELAFFLEKRVPQVKFVDRTFNCKKSHAMEIWRYILEHDNGVTNFHFEIAADLLDEEELQILGQMRPGLVQLEIGVQSTNPRTIREIRRSMDLDRLKRTVAAVNAGHNIHQHLDLIVGLPYEDFDSFRRSFNEVYAMEPEQLQMGFLKVLKGSWMYEMAPEYELSYRQLPPYEVLSTRWISYGEVLRLKGIENMLEVHYNSGQFGTTLRLLQKEFDDPFSMYEALAEYYDKMGLNGRSHSRIARYEILHEFIRSRLDERTREDAECSRKAAGDRLEAAGCSRENAGHSRESDLARYEDALMCDLYLRENSKSRPSFAPDQSPYKEQIRALVPQLRTLGTQIHVEVLQSGKILLFDYRKRDPLTNNAFVTELSE